MTETQTSALGERTRVEEYARVPIKGQITKLNGLSARKVANVIHNSLMLVENTEELNYNASARLYKLFTSRMDEDQKAELKGILSEYRNEDAEFKRRLEGVTNFRHSRKKDLAGNGTYKISTAEDLAADIFANVQYRAAISTASGKQEDPDLEGLARGYLKMEPELKKRGMTIDSVQLNHLTSDYSIGGRNIYRSYMEDFMGKYNESVRSRAKMTIRGEGKDFVGPVRGDSLKERFDRDLENGFVGEQKSAPEGFTLPQVATIENRLEVLFGEGDDTKTQQEPVTTKGKSEQLNTKALLLQ